MKSILFWTSAAALAAAMIGPGVMAWEETGDPTVPGCLAAILALWMIPGSGEAA